MKYVRILLSTAALLLAVACTGAGTAFINLPSALGDGGIKMETTSFGTENWQKLDIYTPKDTGRKKLDVIVFFYGGRWSFGERHDYRFAGRALADQGFLVVIPDYRKYPAVKFPDFVHDGAQALSWVYDHIEQYNGDKTHIHVVGHSAGAHIGSLLTADERYLAKEGKKASDVIRRFAGLAGPYAFTPEEDDLKDMFGPKEKYPLMQAPTYIDGKEPPMLLLHGASDTAVGLFNLQKLETKIKEKGGRVRSIVYPGVTHVGLMASVSWLKNEKTPVIRDMVAFFRKDH